MLGTARKGWPVPNPGPADAGSSFLATADENEHSSDTQEYRHRLACACTSCNARDARTYLVEWRAGRPLSRPAPLRSATVARCSVADSWPSDGAVEDVEPTRTDPDERAYRINRLGWFRRAHAQRRSARARRVCRSDMEGVLMRDFQRTLELAQNSTDVRGVHRA